MSTYRFGSSPVAATPTLLARSLGDGQEFLLAINEMIDLLQQSEEAQQQQERKTPSSGHSGDLLVSLHQSASSVSQTCGVCISSVEMPD
jgi:plasmid maintenance system antidote protein VapI